MRNNLIEFLFEMPDAQLSEAALGENMIKLFEGAEAEETTGAIKCDKKPLATALKAIGISAEVTAGEQWCEVCFDNEADYREATTKLTDPDAMYKLAEAGWVSVKCGDQAMSNEDPCFRIGFIEIQEPEPSETTKPEDAEKIRKEAQKDDLGENLNEQDAGTVSKIVQAVKGRLTEYGQSAEAAGTTTTDKEWSDYVWEMCRHFARYYRLTGEAMVNAARQAYQQLIGNEASGEQIGAARQSGYYESLKQKTDELLEMTSAGAIPMACDVPTRPPMRARGTKKQIKREKLQ